MWVGKKHLSLIKSNLRTSWGFLFPRRKQIRRFYPILQFKLKYLQKQMNVWEQVRVSFDRANAMQRKGLFEETPKRTQLDKFGLHS